MLGKFRICLALGGAYRTCAFAGRQTKPVTECGMWNAGRRGTFHMMVQFTSEAGAACTGGHVEAVHFSTPAMVAGTSVWGCVLTDHVMAMFRTRPFTA